MTQVGWEAISATASNLAAHVHGALLPWPAASETTGTKS
jgi:hypothetical protein